MSEYMVDPLGVETYGYPQVHIYKNHVQICQGWFFPDLDPDEAAWYLDYYFDKEGTHELILDGCWIRFDFWTPLKEYEMGFISGTIEENFKIPKHIAINEIMI